MSVLTDNQIRERCVNTDTPMIYPFKEKLENRINGVKIPSRGLSSMGYDISLDRSGGLKVFTNAYGAQIDPLNIDIQKTMIEPDVRVCERTGLEYITLPPNSYLLGSSVEYFRMPRDILGICLGKSTLARTGLAVNITPLEAGWDGQLTVEVASQVSLPMRVYLEVGIAQIVFLQSSEPCGVGYADRSGKYQGQLGLTHARA